MSLRTSVAEASYRLRFVDGVEFDYPLGKIVCVGRNYAEHAQELNNPIPLEPLLFIKPESSAVRLTEPLRIPIGECHYETELAVLLGAPLRHATPAEVRQSIRGLGLALDLTRRDIQTHLKAQGHPWEIAKGFDGACPLSDFVAIEHFSDLTNVTFSLQINGQLRQKGSSAEMLNPVLPLLAYMSQHFTLKPGDVVLTGTPKGVGLLRHGDQLQLILDGRFVFETVVS